MTEETPEVKLETRDRIARITLSNPARRNAVTRGMWATLTRIAGDLGADGSVRVVVIRGAGATAFASGADISEFGDARKSAGQASAYESELQAALAAIEAIPVPVVALVQGFCVGAGTAIALSCDLRYLDETARFGIPAAKLGIGYSPVWVRKLVNVVGPAVAAEMLMTGRLFDAAKAGRCGFANEVLPAAEIESFTEAQLQAIAANAPLSLAAAKTSIREIIAFDQERDWEAPFAAARACAESEDYLIALEAFAEKRKPVFGGR